MKRFIQSYVFITRGQKKCSTKKKKFLSGDVTFRLPDASYRCEPTQNYVNMSLKKFLCAVSMLLTAMVVNAGKVADTFAELEALHGIAAAVDMPVDNSSMLANMIESGKVIVLDKSNLADVDRILKALPEEYKWLNVLDEEASVLMFGEKSDEDSMYDVILEVVSPEENILMYLKGKPALFEKGIPLFR